MTDATDATVDFDLEYESKFWLPVPGGFAPDGPGVEEWATALIRDYTVAAPFDVPPLDAVLPGLLARQWADLDPERSALLWFCPWGLPPAGYVEILVEPRAEGEFSWDTHFSMTTSELDIFPQEVRSATLGDGVAFSRVVAIEAADGPRTADGPDASDRSDDEPTSYGEVTYGFTPGRAVVVIRCVSGESSVLGLMGPDVWEMIESMMVRS